MTLGDTAEFEVEVCCKGEGEFVDEELEFCIFYINNAVISSNLFDIVPSEFIYMSVS